MGRGRSTELIRAGPRLVWPLSDIAESRARMALDLLRRLAITTYPIEPMIDRIWELRSTMLVYDAWYIALAERLSTTLVTTDRCLAGANGPRCEIEVVG